MRYFLLCIASLFLLVSCSSEQPSETIPLVAEWNNYSVDQQEFRKLYIQETTQKPITDSFEQRKRLATEMIHLKILADQAREESLDTLPEVTERIRRAKEHALRKAYIQETLLNRIPEPTKTDIRAVFDKQNTTLELEQIYSSSEREIDSLYTQLESGTPFETLAATSMSKYNVPNPQSAWQMGEVSWNDMDLAPESVAYNLEIGEISRPVPSLNGYHIFRLTNRTRTIQIDESSFETARENLEFDFTQRRFDELSITFIDSTLKVHPLAVNVNVVQRILPVVEQWAQEISQTNSYPVLLKKFSDMGFSDIDPQQVIASLDDKPFTVEEFFARLPEIPLQIIQQGMRRTLEFMLKDKLFAEIARKNGYETHPDVITAQKLATTQALYLARLNQAVSNISEEKITQFYYEQNTSDFVKELTTHFKAYNFRDSLSAWKVINAYKKIQNWSQAVSTHSELFEESEEKMTANYSEPGEAKHRIHNLPISTEQNRFLSGPFKLGKGYTLVEVTSRDVTYFSPEEIAESLQQQTHLHLQETLTHYLLPDNFRTKDVIIHQKNLSGALPPLIQQ